MEFDPSLIENFGSPEPVPELLHSAYDKAAFSSCTICSKSLEACGLYEIQKVFHGTEAVFEMAICQACGEALAREFSEESIASVHRFLLGNYRPSENCQHCNFCGLPRGLIPNFTALGVCRSESLVVPTIIVCERCTEGLQEKLSKKTRDVQGDFIGDHFPGVPEGLDLSPSLSGIF